MIKIPSVTPSNHINNAQIKLNVDKNMFFLCQTDVNINGLYQPKSFSKLLQKES